MNNLPSGTVTFLFTDIEGSTKLWENDPEGMKVALQRHHEILNCAIESNGGVVFQIIGDAFCAAFPTAPSAIRATVDAQKELFVTNWNLPAPIRVRMGIHTGIAEPALDESATGGYTSNQTLNRVARIMSAGHGGQILLSLATEELTRGSLPTDTELRDMGEHRLRDLVHPERLFQLKVKGLPSEFPLLKTLDAYRSNLPIQLTDFIGREKELAEIAEALAQNRLVTLIGSGGTGKTRLAIEAGTAQLTDHHFTNGVYFVALAPLENTEAIVPTIASALGFSFYEGGEPRQQLLDYLREKSMLLIMDNFEHLLSGVDIVTDILNTAPKVKILATSRARLNVQGEQLFHLSGMDFPKWEAPQDASEYSAVKLFIQTAHRVRSDFELTTDDIRYIVRLCRLVDGMPLGILLAASWIEMLAPEEIATEIEKSLDFLETRQRDLPDRQHSMRAVFDYSWKLLTPGEQNVFMKSSVFRGGFTREAAQQVMGASLRDLMGLVDKSLLQRNPSGRYGIHELLRQYGAERLGQYPSKETDTRDRHCAYYAEFLKQRHAQLIGKEQKCALDEISSEIENVHMGWDWALAQAKIENIRMSLESLAEFYRIRAWYEKGETACNKAIQMLIENQKEQPNREAMLLMGETILWHGRFYRWLGLQDKSEHSLKESITIFRALGDRKDEAYAFCYMGGCEDLYGNNDEGSGCLEGLAIFREIDDKRGVALALRGIAWTALHHGEYMTAKKHFQDSLLLFREEQYMQGITGSLGGLGYVSWILGEYQEAKQYHQEMLKINMENSDQGGIARALGDLGIDAYGFQDYEEAYRLFHKSFDLYKEIGNKHGLDDELGDLGEASNALGKYELAYQFAQEGLPLSQSLYAYNRSWLLRVLGNAACGMGNLHQAKKYFSQALKQESRKGYLLLTLVGIAKLMIVGEKKEIALDLLVFVINHQASWQMAKDQAAPLIAELESKLPPDIVTITKKRSRARDLNATVAELLYELKE